MTVRGSRLVALLAVLLIALVDPSAGAATKKKTTKKSTHRRAAATRKAAPAPVEAATGATFEERLASLVNGRTSASADTSIQVVELESGRVVAERNPHMVLAPASNMKLFTTAAAIDILKPSFEVTTGVYARGDIDASGTLNGDLKFVGHGDPTIGGRFHDGSATAVIQDWAADLRRAGIKNVHGNLVFEYGYMDTEYIHPTWPVDQLVNWYEAPVSAFSMQEGCVEVRVLPSRAGQQCVVQLEPPTAFLNVQNSCRTGGGLPFITRQRGSNTIIVRGGVPARSGATEVFVTVENPIQYFASVTNEALQRAGISISGTILLTPRDARTDWRLLTKHSTPLSILVYVINKKSQNHYAEQVVKMIGAERRNQGSWASGTASVKEWLTTKVGVPEGEFSPTDGSGMSRNNRASSFAFIQLLRYMWKTPWREEFVSSLPYSGDLDSKFGHRLRNPPYARQVYAKTGYISGVIGLSGYVHAQSGKVYAFSFLFNRYRVGVFAVYRLEDEMLKEIIKNG
ncbi:MAG: D-alanyl-D-alanine carboxypeptidase/D-alanyl-D-alanine-endopeptidase [Acidobacteria bacterium]|nr:D-alanyl-D-alanine carboxypeptidase/D-alanyl-D-alanine-endopeptidase [Acidobacteriota bacterium]MBV9478388.1 D-alanyl-D-alanine carboxypeptidase/D-alanyl-D-alanine-endopeptidase [Acidobacteriota bacterium]